MLTEKIRLFHLRDLLERERKKVNRKQLVKKLSKWWDWSQLLDYAVMGKIVMEMPTAVTARGPCVPAIQPVPWQLFSDPRDAFSSPHSLILPLQLSSAASPEGWRNIKAHHLLFQEMEEYAALGSTSFPCTVGQEASFTHLDGLGSCGYHGPRLWIPRGPVLE